MPKIIPSHELQEIEKIVARHPDGADIREIGKHMTSQMNDWAVRLRLARLIEEGRITASGKRKGTRYHATPRAMTSQEPEAESSGMDDLIPLSVEAREIRMKVMVPIGRRKPVGYDTEFLASYVPNKSEYLSANLRDELAACGQVGASGLPAGTYIRQVMHRLLIDLSWNSSRLEGNTYSLLDTERLIEEGESAVGKNAKETQMILNHKDAIEMLVECVSDIRFNSYTICNLHALLSNNLLADSAACGRLRSRGVGIAGSVFHPLEIPQRIEMCFQQVLEKAEAISDPFEQAFFAMVQLPYLQPFEDVNKRVSRLAANIPLFRRNLCPLSFIDVPKEEYVNSLIGVYELRKVEYLRDVFVWAYKRSAERYAAVRESLGEPAPFRLKYRKLIGETVQEVVEKSMSKDRSAKAIEARADKGVEVGDRSRFIGTIESELSSLHIGNIARYRLAPRQFESWKKTWE